MYSRDRKYASEFALAKAWVGGIRHGDRPREGAWRGRLARPSRLVAALTAFLLAILVGTPVITGAHAVVAPVGNGFTVTPSDLAFILKQIKIAEHHAATLTASNPCGTLVGPGPDQIPDRLTSYGLRTVDGSCNNLFPNRATFAAADQPFPRLTSRVLRDAENVPPGFGPPGPTTYKSKKGLVFDSQPRLISNLIVDETSTNPAAIAAAGFPVRTQGNPGLHPCTIDPDPTALPDPIVGSPAGCVPSHHTLFIPNVTTDVGLSPPYNSLFTFFGQFFDHGVDQTAKSGGTVFVPLHADDPLVTVGPDGIAGTNCTSTDPALPPRHCDEVPPNQAFMVLTRAQNQPGPDGILGDRSPTSSGTPVPCTSLNVPPSCDESADDVQDANNTDSPWVDQSQTYTSHPSHQVFLREYVLNSASHPVSTGKLLSGLATDDALPCAAGTICYNDGNATTGSISTWASTKKQAAQLLGLRLVDKDVTNIPMLATDPYGKFIPGTRGLPQYVTTGPDGILGDLSPTTVAGTVCTSRNVPAGCDESADDALVEGNLAAPVPVPADAVHFDTPFLTDIAHNADPGTVGPCVTPANRTTSPPTPGVPSGCLDPDANSSASADFASQPFGTYDDEMLNDHFTCGDGRCNENIALSTIHQVFHSEHDRLVGDIKSVLAGDTSATGALALAQWKLPTTDNPAGWNGERLFQAARFVTEMEYQHLVFEEFARKIQPAVRPFHVYNPDTNPAIPAEFAHAVYRFGHSMLDDDVARTNANGSDNSVPLLTAFLNPPEYFNGGLNGPARALTPEEAAGSIVMGSSDQVGSELDEFVVETLRNNLLGLPLDLPTLNMTRAREAGIPPLNEVRRQINAATNDGQMAPYTSWSDFGQHLKHPESLINFVAAYGQHPSITSATTLAGKRAAAKAIVDPAPTDVTPIPEDAAAFMFGTDGTSPTCLHAACDWRSTAAGVTTTGLDDVDLWVGGLAEVTNLFGGLLGSTFNYVFETSLENLQDFDRLYYLNRTQGMNLRTQLEGNSFAELIQRNTDGTNSLKADAFATADCKFQLGSITFPFSNSPVPISASQTPPLAAITGAGSVNDVASTPDCDENQLLLRKPDGTIQYRAVNNIDPVGINGQSVYNGTPAVDRIFGGNDNDTFWGGAGNDVIEGNGGDDVALGGDGNDIVTDLAGADTLKGGPGNDALDGGIGDDIFMGGDDQDFINGGANDNETFAGPGNDFIIAGQGADAVFGDGGDDWIEGGSGQDLLQGDHGAPFFDDPGQAAPGNDIFIGQVGENDYDTEGGDDVMSQNAAVDRNAGAAGFDWAFHQYDTVGADDDMEINNNLVGVPIQVVVNRDRWQETEADSGSAFNDVIKGTSVAPATIGGAGFAGCDVLGQASLDRISGLDALVPTLTGDPAPVIASSAAGFCPTTGPIWGDGDILLGGAGSDTITGRGTDDIIDGDKSLQIKISVRTNPADPASEIGSTDLMEGLAKTGTFGAGTTGMTLQKAVFAGLVDPGNLVAVREIVSPAAGTDVGAVDTAVFSGPSSNYTIDAVPATAGSLASVRVTQTGADVVGQKVSDGIDTLRNIENLRFCNNIDPVTLLCTAFDNVALSTPGTPTLAAANSATAGNASATLSFTGPSAPATGPAAITGFDLLATPVGGGTPVARTGLSRTATSGTVTGLTNGVAYTLQVRAVNGFGAGSYSVASNQVTPSGPAPLVTTRSPAVGASNVAVGANVTATFDQAMVPGGFTTATVQLTGPGATVIPAAVSYNAITRTVTLNPTPTLAQGTTYTATLTGGAAAIRSTANVPLATTSWSFTTVTAVNPPPTVIAQTPLPNSVGVGRAANITARFSEAVTGVSGTTFTLRNTATNAVVAATVTNPTNRRSVLNPAATLLRNTQYTVTLTGGPAAIRDLAGAPLVTVTWTFTTAP